MWFTVLRDYRSNTVNILNMSLGHSRSHFNIGEEAAIYSQKAKHDRATKQKPERSSTKFFLL